VNEDQLQGKVDQAKGDVKQGVGGAVGDSSTETSGMFDKVKGEIEELVGDVKEKFSHHDDAPKV
jgi:uncharacterized protein YjbJ (UPF0337 family)